VITVVLKRAVSRAEEDLLVEDQVQGVMVGEAVADLQEVLRIVVHNVAMIEHQPPVLVVVVLQLRRASTVVLVRELKVAVAGKHIHRKVVSHVLRSYGLILQKSVCGFYLSSRLYQVL
jgi:hypothetical protein